MRAAAPAGRPIRVSIVAPSLDILGGQAVQAARLMQRLSGVADVSIHFIPVNPRLPGPLRALQKVKYVRTIVTSIAYIARLLRDIPRTDVVHAFSASYFSYLLAPLPAILIGKAFGKRVLLNYRSGEAEDHLQRSVVAVRSMRLVDLIVVPSGYLVDVFNRFGLRAVAVPNFVEIDRIPYRRRKPLSPVFLSNRNFDSLYNIPCTLRAFAIIQRHHSDARLIVVGGGPEAERLSRLAHELDLRNVEFIGRIPAAEMPSYYDRGDVYLNSPNIDNMPTSIIEAFAAGLPVVSTNAGGIPFIVTHGETGLLVSRNDHEAMATEALRLLADASLAERLANNGRNEVIRRYVWAQVEAQWIAVYAGRRPTDIPQRTI
jgi:L-malate glycosyltransferase